MIINAFIETDHINMTLHRYCFSKKKKEKERITYVLEEIYRN